MIVADTNVVSEFMKAVPDDAAYAWAQGVDPSDLAMSVVTFEEIERGLQLLPQGRRRCELTQRWNALLIAFEDAVLLYDLVAARATAAVQVACLEQGRPMSLADAQIAGICLAGGHILATRNVKDFTPSGVQLVNPFSN